MTFEGWLAFMAIWVAASIPLGPNALNCISSSVTHGFRRGLWSVAGVFFAALVHMSLAISGISAFMAANPVLFEVLRWLGVAYLAWMGVSMLRVRGGLEMQRQAAEFSRSRAVRRAFLISMSNPKAIFAWLAVFSQFVSASAPLGPQLMVLAPSALAVTLIVYGVYCGLGRSFGRVFSSRRKRWFDRGAGATYLTFAAGLAVADMRRV